MLKAKYIENGKAECRISIVDMELKKMDGMGETEMKKKKKKI